MFIPHCPGFAGLILRSFGTSFKIFRRSFTRRLRGLSLTTFPRGIAIRNEKTPRI